MTVLVGILCEDGVVIGSDSSATFSAGPHFKTIEQKAIKVFVVPPDVIVAGTGAVGLGQRFTSVVHKVRDANDFKQKDKHDVAKLIASAVINDFAAIGAPKGMFGAMVAFRSKQGLELCEFDTQNLVPEFKTDGMWFVSMGSGQPLADPFLAFLCRVFFEGKSPKLSEGVFAVHWALEHAIELNPGGINGPSQIATLGLNAAGRAYEAKLLDEDELSSHSKNREAAEAHLRAYRDVLGSTAATTTTPPPAAP